MLCYVKKKKEEVVFFNLSNKKLIDILTIFVKTGELK